MREVEVGGLRITYERAGPGPPLVLPGAGHVCNVEAPKEFNTVVRSFLLGSLRR